MVVRDAKISTVALVATEENKHLFAALTLNSWYMAEHYKLNKVFHSL